MSGSASCCWKCREKLRFCSLPLSIPCRAIWTEIQEIMSNLLCLIFLLCSFKYMHLRLVFNFKWESSILFFLNIAPLLEENYIIPRNKLNGEKEAPIVELRGNGPFESIFLFILLMTKPQTLVNRWDLSSRLNKTHFGAVLRSSRNDSNNKAHILILILRFPAEIRERLIFDSSGG